VLGVLLLRQVPFGERTIEEASDAWGKRVGERKRVWEMRARVAIAEKRQEEDEQYQGASEH
jgi:hypothetical protein